MKPVIRPNLRDCPFEKAAEISIDVLVRVDGFDGLWIGRYIHGCEEWQVNGIGGSVKVLEWWPMPGLGTGVTP